MIKIDKNVPIPPIVRPGRKPKYPFREMEVSDSFFVAGKIANQIVQCATRCRPKKFVTRKEKNGVRVWRVE